MIFRNQDRLDPVELRSAALQVTTGDDLSSPKRSLARLATPGDSSKSLQGAAVYVPTGGTAVSACRRPS